MNIDKRIGEFALVLKFQVSELSAVGCETQLFIRTTLTAQREIWRRMIDAYRDRFSAQSADHGYGNLPMVSSCVVRVKN